MEQFSSKEWFEIWLQHTQNFFKTSQAQLTDLFKQPNQKNLEESTQKFLAWLAQFQESFNTHASTANPLQQRIWQELLKLYDQAAELLRNEWNKGQAENKPIKDMHQLYEVWLGCCHAAYEKALKTETYHTMYSDYWNNAIKYWKPYMS